MSRWVITGAGGMLGRAWTRLCAEEGRPAVALARGEMDLTRPADIDRAVGADVEVVVNCAAFTDVDGAEAEERAATAVNGEGVGRLARRCAEVGALLVHYSTDYVFDGEASEPYPVDAPTRPVNAYGRSKLAGEEAIRAAGGPSLVVRTSWLYAPWGKNFVLTMARLATERDELRVVNDQRGRPTSAVRLARSTLELARAGARGTFHLCDGGDCTWFDLASEVAWRVRPACRVLPCSTAEFPRPAPRPRYSVLDTRDAEAIVGPPAPWTESVAVALAAAGHG